MQQSKESVSTRLAAGVEAGGTKFRVAVGSAPHDLRTQTTIPTTDPRQTLAATVEFLSGMEFSGLGIATFGPIDLDESSPTYGTILATPKADWAGTDMLGELRERLAVPTAIDTDVGAAALAERLWGAARGLDDVVYFTVGTGIGAGILVGGEIHHGFGHPEVGHVPVEREPEDTFEGNCPFHGACLEGMAAGPAIEARWGSPAPQLSNRDDVWDLEARYLAQAVRTVTYVMAPQRVLFGGGVSGAPRLIERIIGHLPRALGGYGASPGLVDALGSYVVAAELGQDAGLAGALALGLRAGEV